MGLSTRGEVPALKSLQSKIQQRKGRTGVCGWKDDLLSTCIWRLELVALPVNLESSVNLGMLRNHCIFMIPALGVGSEGGFDCDFQRQWENVSKHFEKAPRPGDYFNLFAASQEHTIPYWKCLASGADRWRAQRLGQPGLSLTFPGGIKSVWPCCEG